ncbi:MAG: DUF1805 domain-containing protein [Elusimicrobia bacterium]|nr:DUF1805 domain-containing protein [Candidatus Obscuribacterium magneticum]
MKTMDVEIDGKKGTGVVIELSKAPLVLVHGKHGFVMCGYLSMETAEKMGVAAALVRGVNSVDDLLKAKIAAVTKAASDRGVRIDMTGRDALACLL